MKYWEGLGYYSRARNLKNTAVKILKEYNGRLPSTIEELKTLPGIGDYTSRAIMAIAFNKKIIPLDGNVERIIKRVFYLRKENEISKEYINNKIHFFGTSNRSSDYAQALMELGALVCKPKNPLCTKCPIIKNCTSYKKKDFDIAFKNKKKINKFFIIKVFKRGNKILLIKNTKFKFLKNFKIFPMEEIKKPQNLNNSLNLKMSNMNMNINIKRIKEFSNISNGSWIDQTKFNQYTLPTFTKKIFASLNKSL